MSSVRIRHRPWWIRVVIGVLAVAVLLMHALVTCCGDHLVARGEMHEVERGATPPRLPHDDVPVSMTTAGDTSTGHMSDAGDCVMGHHCVFVRGDDVPTPPVILVLLVWGFAALPVLVGIAPALLGHLGRPPPWAQPTHLTLSVIRC
ncbi:hypothetical protein [Gordonia sp. DT30]